MPKETIKHEDRSDPNGMSEDVVAVIWDRETGEVAIQSHWRRITPATEEGPHRPPCLAGSVCGEAAHCPPLEEGAAVYQALDRQQINRLIRVLRRARDAVMGADA